MLGNVCGVVEHETLCNSPVHVIKFGMCSKHYTRLRKYGDPLFVKKVSVRSDGKKRCPECEQWLDTEHFGPSGYCKECAVMKTRAWKYNLTVQQLKALLSGAKCDACGDTDPGSVGYWHIDHDHSCCSGKTSCGKCIRGVLCQSCNFILGNANDNPDKLIALVSYLKKGRWSC